MSNGKILLAYSGGLDTSCILKWFLERDYEVLCYMANIGQDEDFDIAKEKALKIGASKVIIDDIRNTFVRDYVWPSIQAGLVYESRYLLGTSIARPCISAGLIKCAKENGVKYISHGATGKGNDQVRFELSCYSLWPEVQIIAPWRLQEFTDKFQGRQDLLQYARKHGIPVSATPKAPWSIDANLMHVSYESGILENPENEPLQEMFLMTKHPRESPDHAYRLEVVFEKGLPISIATPDNKLVTDCKDMLTLLNRIGGEFGIGRIDIVENRFIGLKSRGVYESPGAHILHVAHNDLEVFCLDREVYRIKRGLSDKLADYIYNGFWFSPEGKYIRKCITLAEEQVNGIVKLELYKGNVFVLGRSSSTSTYNEALVSMDVQSTFSPSDATGFINIHAIRLKEHQRINKGN